MMEVFEGGEIHLGDMRDVMPTLGPVDAIFTDPPYEQVMQDLHANVKLRRLDGGPQRRDLDFESVKDLRDPFLKECKRINKGWLLAFCNVEGVGEWNVAINAHDMKFKTPCIWNKPDATPKLNGQGPALSYECIVTAWCGPGYSKWNGGGRRGVFTHPTNNRHREGSHPAEKPLALMQELVALFTDKGQTVLDCFAGSGTTLLACASLGRKFIGVELQRKYFDVACRRIEKVHKPSGLFTGGSMKSLMKQYRGKR